MKNKVKNKWVSFFIILAILTVTATCVILILKKPGNVPPPEITETETPETDQDFHFHHTIGEPVIEFDEGNEVFLDTSLLAYLERMEVGTPDVDENGNYYFDADGDIVYDQSEEKNLEGVLDNLITLINDFAKEEYSMEASHQIQRFYVSYYDCLDEFEYDDLVEKLKICFPSGGADSETLGATVLSTFGIDSGDGCSFVFRPLEVAEIKVIFSDVRPGNVSLSDELKTLNIYENWKNEEDDYSERNLEGWLDNMIFVANNYLFDEEKIIVSEILYAGSLANAEYRSDWADALVRCLSITDWDYDIFKAKVNEEFGVCIDFNQPLIDCFLNINSEVIE